MTLLEKEKPTHENLLLKADCHIKLSNYIFAMDIYKQLLEDHPVDATLMIAMAECHASQSGESNQSLH